jgi:hypothetical protein
VYGWPGQTRPLNLKRRICNSPLIASGPRAKAGPDLRRIGSEFRGVIRHKRGDTLNKNLPNPISNFGADTTLEVMRRVTGATSIQAIQQVVDRGRGGWAVRKVGSERATKVFPSQKKAIAFARDGARKQGDVLYIHSRDGSVRE